MREVSFHGKRKGDGAWVEGNLLIDRAASPDSEDKYFIVTYANLSNLDDLSEFIIYEVIPETVVQFTGLYDRKRTEEYPNGQPIYEGDIIRIHYHKSQLPEIIAPVVFYIGRFCGLHKTEYRVISYPIPQKELSVTDWCEVIGNVFDNPELLEGAVK